MSLKVNTWLILTISIDRSFKKVREVNCFDKQNKNKIGDKTGVVTVLSKLRKSEISGTNYKLQLQAACKKCNLDTTGL